MAKRKKQEFEFEWPEPDPEKYPDQECECGGVVRHNGFPGEYWCAACESGFYKSA